MKKGDLYETLTPDPDDNINAASEVGDAASEAGNAASEVGNAADEDVEDVLSGQDPAKGKKKKEKKIRRTLISRFDILNRFKHWYLGGISFFRGFFRVHAAKQTIGLIMGALAIGFIMAAFYTQSGEFVVKVSREMARDGFYLSEIPNFDERLITLHAVAKLDATNISIYDLEDDLMDIDGVHHGPDYFAYTFYCKNWTGRTIDYRYTLYVRHQTLGIEEASWIMFFHNGEQEVFAQESKSGGPEVQYSDLEFPFLEYAKYPEQQQTMATGAALNRIPQDTVDRLGLRGMDSVYQFNTVPFASGRTICTGLRPDFEHDGMDKFTVVIWLEGEDPECVDRIIGGELELAMSFTY